jgi:hypothetical protein
MVMTNYDRLSVKYRHTVGRVSVDNDSVGYLNNLINGKYQCFFSPEYYETHKLLQT